MPEVMRLQVETGAVTVAVEDERGETLGQFDFNPADSNILKRYGDVAAFFGRVDYGTEDMTEEEQLQAMDRLCDDIRAQFDYLLGTEAAEGLFGKCGPLTVTKDGSFYFERVLDGLGGLIEQVTKKRLDRKLDRIRKAAAAAPHAKKADK